MIPKVVRTICAIANVGSGRGGKVLIGVTDKEDDARRASALDGIEPQKVGLRYVVGVNREAKRLELTTERYFSLWKDGIRNSNLQTGVKDQILSNIDYNSFFGLGVIVITVPPQTELTYVGDELYFREGDETKKAEGPRQIAALAKRF